MFVAHYGRTMRNAKPVADPSPPRILPVLSLPPSPLHFAPKEPKTARIVRERHGLMARAAEIHEQTQKLTGNERDKIKSASAIITDVAREHGVSADDVRGPCKATFLVAVRHQAVVRVYLAHYPRMSLTTIGKFFGGNDHSSIMHALRKAGFWRKGEYSRRRQANDDG